MVYDDIYDVVFNQGYPFKKQLSDNFWEVEIDKDCFLLREYIETQDDYNFYAENYQSNRKIEEIYKDAEFITSDKELITIEHIKINKDLLERLNKHIDNKKIARVRAKEKGQLSLFNIRVF